MLNYKSFMLCFISLLIESPSFFTHTWYIKQIFNFVSCLLCTLLYIRSYTHKIFKKDDIKSRFSCIICLRSDEQNGMCKIYSLILPRAQKRIYLSVNTYKYIYIYIYNVNLPIRCLSCCIYIWTIVLIIILINGI